jgi:hypothetical protein
MPKVRQLLNAACVETAIRQRMCHHNRKKHSIPAKTRCLVIRDVASGGSKNYCPECAEAIFTRVDLDLAALRNALTGP